MELRTILKTLFKNNYVLVFLLLLILLCANVYFVASFKYDGLGTSSNLQATSFNTTRANSNFILNTNFTFNFLNLQRSVTDSRYVLIFKEEPLIFFFFF